MKNEPKIGVALALITRDESREWEKRIVVPIAIKVFQLNCVSFVYDPLPNSYGLVVKDRQ